MFGRVAATKKASNQRFKAFLIEFVILVVGVAGFEPTTSCSQSRRDTGLRYTPNVVSTSTTINHFNGLTFVFGGANIQKID